MHSILVSVSLILLCLTVSGQDDRTRYFPRQVEIPKKLPKKKNVWIFIMAGQSNMAGRGVVEPQDTIPNSRILTIDSNNKIIMAKEPLHFYEPNLTGLDCGYAFANQLVKNIDESITVLLLPVAVGGSSSQQWLGDSLHRNVKLLSNFKNRVDIIKKYGTIKGILWHQGESDTQSSLIADYGERLKQLFATFRNYVGNPVVPILIGELGSYSENQTNWALINKEIHKYAVADKNAFVINTQDLKSKDDKIHFNSEGQRIMGERMAKKFLEINH
ncbi:sialate O-acetylesterase [Chryseolinea sp. H1M3-3]|uniref:sialate O-acetylesterase n=1 Tax=Chryseolinea sp. H1M3-3 TaxID=3034144 RepID=UPI0023EC2F23|nr:sialate O-acetylesterase [Chryseolinea sp. H1M3-3]